MLDTVHCCEVYLIYTTSQELALLLSSGDGHCTDDFSFCIISDNGQDHTWDLLNARLVC
jgi:hypothetical protein